MPSECPDRFLPDVTKLSTPLLSISWTSITCTCALPLRRLQSLAATYAAVQHCRTSGAGMCWPICKSPAGNCHPLTCPHSFLYEPALALICSPCTCLHLCVGTQSALELADEVVPSACFAPPASPGRRCINRPWPSCNDDTCRHVKRSGALSNRLSCWQCLRYSAAMLPCSPLMAPAGTRGAAATTG